MNSYVSPYTLTLLYTLFSFRKPKIKHSVIQSESQPGNLSKETLPPHLSQEFDAVLQQLADGKLFTLSVFLSVSLSVCLSMSIHGNTAPSSLKKIMLCCSSQQMV